MKFEAKAISDGCLCFCFRSYRWIFYGIWIIPIYKIISVPLKSGPVKY